ncbi:MAG: polymerase sigma factor RpoE [Labilithrix sp.]|nr:polymerase sigma factor RpoE [Labilithrix sp.]
MIGEERRVREDDVVASMTIEALFSTYMAFVWRSLRRLGVSEAELEDQTQEVFMIAHRRLSEWDGQHPRAWLFAIARRCASAYRRRSHRRHERPCESLPEETDSRDPAMSVELGRVRRAIAALEEDRRTVLVLRELEEMSMREVAEALQISVFTAYSRLYAARRDLARALEEAP